MLPMFFFDEALWYSSTEMYHLPQNDDVEEKESQPIEGPVCEVVFSAGEMKTFHGCHFILEMWICVMSFSRPVFISFLVEFCGACIMLCSSVTAAPTRDSPGHCSCICARFRVCGRKTTTVQNFICTHVCEDASYSFLNERCWLWLDTNQLSMLLCISWRKRAQ